MNGWILRLAAFGLLLSVSQASGEVIVVYPTADANLDYATFNEYVLETNMPFLEATKSTAPAFERRFAVEFDLSQIPEYATVKYATLSLSNYNESLSPLLINGYAGTGTIDLSDMYVSNPIASVSDYGPHFASSIKVTNFLQSLVDSSSTFAGFMGQADLSPGVTSASFAFYGPYNNPPFPQSELPSLRVFYEENYGITTVPEPATFILGIGIFGMAMIWRQRAKLT